MELDEVMAKGDGVPKTEGQAKGEEKCDGNERPKGEMLPEKGAPEHPKGVL